VVREALAGAPDDCHDLKKTKGRKRETILGKRGNLSCTTKADISDRTRMHSPPVGAESEEKMERQKEREGGLYKRNLI